VLTDDSVEVGGHWVPGTIQQVFDSRRNSLGFLRMAFAVMVLIDQQKVSLLGRTLRR